MGILSNCSQLLGTEIPQKYQQQPQQTMIWIEIYGPSDFFFFSSLSLPSPSCLILGSVLFKFAYNIMSHWIDFICVLQVKSGRWSNKQMVLQHIVSRDFCSDGKLLHLHSFESKHNNG